MYLVERVALAELYKACRDIIFDIKQSYLDIGGGIF